MVNAPRASIPISDAVSKSTVDDLDSTGCKRFFNDSKSQADPIINPAGTGSQRFSIDPENSKALRAVK